MISSKNSNLHIKVTRRMLRSLNAAAASAVQTGWGYHNILHV